MEKNEHMMIKKFKLNFKKAGKWDVWIKKMKKRTRIQTSNTIGNGGENF